MYWTTFRTNYFLLNETWESILVDAFFLLDEELLILNQDITLIDSIISISLVLTYFNLLFSFKWKLIFVFLQTRITPFHDNSKQNFCFLCRFAFDFVMYLGSIYCLFNVWGTIYINQHFLKYVQLNCVTWDQILSFSLSLTRGWVKWKVASEICHFLDKMKSCFGNMPFLGQNRVL